MSDRLFARDPTASQTDWTMIYQAAHGDAAPAAEAWESVARRYWPAIYAYARSSGRDHHEAADLTQGFVCDVLMGRRLLESADPSRGRFRTLLLTALKRYINEQHRQERRRRRSPGDGVVQSIDFDSALSTLSNTLSPLSALLTSATPEAVFDAQWSATLVRRVLDGLRRECEAEGLTAHWAVFEARVVRPMLHGSPPVDYQVLVATLGIKDAAQAANMMITIKRRFSRSLFAEVARTVRDPSETEEELHALLRALERPA